MHGLSQLLRHLSPVLLCLFFEAREGGGRDRDSERTENSVGSMHGLFQGAVVKTPQSCLALLVFGGERERERERERGGGGRDRQLDRHRVDRKFCTLAYVTGLLSGTSRLALSVVVFRRLETGFTKVF